MYYDIITMKTYMYICCMIFVQQNMQEYTHLHILHYRYLHVNVLYNMTPWLKPFTQ